MQALLSSERPLAYQLEGSGLVTSLPYLDDLSDKALLKQAKKLVSQELEAAEDCSAKVDLQGLDTDVETPHLDHLAEAALGKRSTASGSRDREPPKRDPYEASAISIEQLKERYARVSRLIHLKIIKKNIHALAQVQLQVNAGLKAKLQTDLQQLGERCTKVNELRRFNQVRTAHPGKAARVAARETRSHQRVVREAAHHRARLRRSQTEMLQTQTT